MKKLRTIALAGAAALAAFALALFLVGEPRHRSDIYAWTPDGAVFRVSPRDDGTYYQACVSPDGTNVVFGGAETGPPRIWRAELPSGEARPLTPPDSAAFLASYDWSGREIVFSSDRDFDLPSIEVQDAEDPRLYRGATKRENKRDFNLYVMAADGSSVRRVTRGPYRDLRASFTPDGERLVFYSDRRPRVQFWTVAADGSDEPTPLPLTGEVARYAYRPWYTADAEMLYFFAEPFGEPGRKRLMRVDAAGGVPETLAFDDVGKTQAPFLDPNGGILLFHTNRTGRSELYEVALDSNEPRMLVPPGLEIPPGGEVMHPTRSRDGTITFDLNYYEGSAATQWLYALRIRLIKGVRWRLRSLFD